MKPCCPVSACQSGWAEADTEQLSQWGAGRSHPATSPAEEVVIFILKDGFNMRDRMCLPECGFVLELLCTLEGCWVFLSPGDFVGASHFITMGGNGG